MKVHNARSSEIGKCIVAGVRLWRLKYQHNNPCSAYQNTIKLVSPVKTFKARLKTILFNSAWVDVVEKTGVFLPVPSMFLFSTWSRWTEGDRINYHHVHRVHVSQQSINEHKPCIPSTINGLSFGGSILITHDADYRAISNVIFDRLIDMIIAATSCE